MAMFSIFITPILILASVLVAVPAHAQEIHIDPETAAPITAEFQQEMQQRNSCFDYYRYGSVRIDLESGNAESYAAGQTVTVRGAIVNTNSYGLEGGKLVAIIRRDDETMSEKNWHPGVTQVTLPEVYSIAAGASVPFVFRWDIPQHAPAGQYRIELSYLAAGRYVMAGIPYVMNMPGARFLFTVEQPDGAHAAYVRRNTVHGNGLPIKLRDIPPVYSSGVPVEISFDATALGSSDVPTDVHAALYSWSMTDGKEPVVEKNESLVLRGGVSSLVSFLWDRSEPGTYELVVTLTPKLEGTLPSLVKIRFAVEGNVPRIIYSGVGGYEGDEAIVVSCIVNETEGVVDGNAQTDVRIGGTIVAGANGALSPDGLTVLQARVPQSDLDRSGVSIVTSVKDSQGGVYDAHEVVYQEEVLSQKQGTDARQMLLYGTAALVGLLIVVIGMRLFQLR